MPTGRARGARDAPLATGVVWLQSPMTTPAGAARFIPRAVQDAMSDRRAALVPGAPHGQGYATSLALARAGGYSARRSHRFRPREPTPPEETTCRFTPADELQDTNAPARLVASRAPGGEPAPSLESAVGFGAFDNPAVADQTSDERLASSGCWSSALTLVVGSGSVSLSTKRASLLLASARRQTSRLHGRRPWRSVSIFRSACRTTRRAATPTKRRASSSASEGRACSRPSRRSSLTHRRTLRRRRSAWPAGGRSRASRASG